MWNRARLIAAALTVILTATAEAQEWRAWPDSGFVPVVGDPAFPDGDGPVVLFDAGHHNYHTLDGVYLAFARLIERDGYRIRELRGHVDAEVLADVDLFVTAGAGSAASAARGSDFHPSAFTVTEIENLRAWVRDGGALLLIADHAPGAAAYGDLAAAFGVVLFNGFARDPRTGEFFRRRDGTLVDHPITEGRTRAERIDSVRTFVGTAFLSDDRLTPLLIFSNAGYLELPIPGEERSSRPAPWIKAGGFYQAGVRTVGRGRLGVFGEAAMFSAQNSTTGKAGMNVPGSEQNAQFVVNVIRWLTGVL